MNKIKTFLVTNPLFAMAILGFFSTAALVGVVSFSSTPLDINKSPNSAKEQGQSSSGGASSEGALSESGGNGSTANSSTKKKDKKNSSSTGNTEIETTGSGTEPPEVSPTPNPGSSPSPTPTPSPSPSPTPTPSPSPSPTPSPPPSGRTIIWSDEFDSGSLNTTYWTPEYSTYGDGNNELQCYTTSQVNVSGGKLILTAKEQSTTCPGGKVRTVTSGMVRSKNVAFSPGMSIEWSAKLTPNDDANQGGLWPALWSSGWAGSWPYGGEWDGFEVMTAVDPTRTVYSLHYQNTVGAHGKTSTNRYGPGNFSDSWHTFRFDYGADGVFTWYRDGYQTKQTTTADTMQGWPAPFNQNMKEIKINLALGGNPGPLDTRALPATLEIGWIRIYNE